MYMYMYILYIVMCTCVLILQQRKTDLDLHHLWCLQMKCNLINWLLYWMYKKKINK